MVNTTTFRDTFVLLETFEKGLNILGYIPGVGTFTAYFRANYATIELITGLALAVLSLAMNLQGDVNSTFYKTVAITLISHSILNFIRTIFEVKPFVALFTTLPYDLISTFYLGRRLFSYVTPSPVV